MKSLQKINITSGEQLQIEKNASYMEDGYRPRVLTLMTKDVKGKPHILALKNTTDRSSSPYSFPGGGTEGQPLLRAAKREALEEVGYRLTGGRVVQEPKAYELSYKWRDRIKKKKGLEAYGIKQSIVHGKVGRRDSRLYNSEGDGMEGARLYPLDKVVESMDRFTSKHETTDPDKLHPFVVANRDIVNALTSIQKKASAQNRDYRKEYLRDHASPEAKANRVKRNYWNRKIKTAPGQEIDHKVPLSKGGSNSRSNIRVTSVAENRAKGEKTASPYSHLFSHVNQHAANAYLVSKERKRIQEYTAQEHERFKAMQRRAAEYARLRKFRQQ